jgi:NADPH2:quinone reductase
MSTVVVATGFGGPKNLSAIDEVLSLPGPGNVRVQIRAVGVNPVDFKLYSGDYGRDPSKLPMRLGYEAAGVVTDVGTEAEGPGGPIRAGDEVIVYPIEGAYAAEVVVGASSVVPKPSSLSFVEASGLMLTGVTAVHALTVTAVTKGDTVVLHGASGGVGLMAVQLAVSAGAHVIATAGVSGHAYLSKLGAEPVTYGDGLAGRIRALAPDGVDASIDLVGTDEALDTSLALVADRQRIATIAAFGRRFDLGIRVLGRAPGADPGVNIRNAARMELVRQAEAGQLSVLVADTYPLSEAATAHRELAKGHTHGKIILIPE